MDLKMEVYSPFLELLGLLEIQNSVMWENKAFSAGSFTLNSLITEESKTLLVPENIIWIAGDDAGIIEYVQQEAGENGPYITVKGCNLTGLLARRILWGRYDLSGPVPEIMYRLVDDCCINPTRGETEARKIPGLVLAGAAPTGGPSIRAQKTGGYLLDALEELGTAYGVPFGVRFNPAVPCMEFWAQYGINRSTHQDSVEPVFYSTELDDVLSSEYSYNSQNWRNVALVAGEGEGKDRVMVVVQNGTEPAPQPPTPPTPTYTIGLSVDPEGGGVASGGGTFTEGQSVTVTATASSGYEFAGWQENGAVVNTDLSYTFTVTADRALTAVFAVIVPTYTVSASIDPEGSGTVTGAGTYKEGQTVTLTADPGEDYKFAAWTENGKTVSESAEYTFTVSESRELTAVFSVKSRLPDGYTEVLYIETDSKIGIDTGIIPNLQSTKFVMDISNISWDYSSSSVGNYIFNTKNIYSGGAYNNFFCRADSGLIKYGIGSKFSNFSSAVNITDRFQISVDCPSSLFIFGNESVSFSSKNLNLSGHLYVGNNVLNQYNASAKFKVYSAQVYNNETLERDFVPCIDPSGIVGLYDLVEGKFYKNAWSGTLTAGPAV